MNDTLIIESGFNGPRLSGNGGYVGGVLADLLGYRITFMCSAILFAIGAGDDVVVVLVTLFAVIAFFALGNFGYGISAQTGELARSLNVARVLLVTDPGIRAAGILGNP